MFLSRRFSSVRVSFDSVLQRFGSARFVRDQFLNSSESVRLCASGSIHRLPVTVQLPRPVCGITSPGTLSSLVPLVAPACNQSLAGLLLGEPGVQCFEWLLLAPAMATGGARSPRFGVRASFGHPLSSVTRAAGMGYSMRQLQFSMPVHPVCSYL